MAAARAGLRFDVAQRDAAVFVDGYYVGSVDDFTADKPPLQLEAGAHRIEIRAAGFETLHVLREPGGRSDDHVSRRAAARPSVGRGGGA